MCLWETCKMKGKGWGKYFWRCLNSWKAGLPRCPTRSWRNHLLIQSTQLLHSGLLFSYLNGPSRIFIAQVQYCRFSFLTVTFFSILFLIFFTLTKLTIKLGAETHFWVVFDGSTDLMATVVHLRHILYGRRTNSTFIAIWIFYFFPLEQCNSLWQQKKSWVSPLGLLLVCAETNILWLLLASQFTILPYFSLWRQKEEVYRRRIQFMTFSTSGASQRNPASDYSRTLCFVTKRSDVDDGLVAELHT